MLVGNSSPFGSASRTRVLLALRLLGQSYARELTRVLGVRLASVQVALRSLERDGLIAGRLVGKTRSYELNPRYFARTELERFLDRLAEPERELKARLGELRRRPRRSGKPA
jgi:DNA-binding transcriptional ArsR family regulator